MRAGEPAPSSEIPGLLSRQLLPEQPAQQGVNPHGPGPYRTVIHAAELADQPVMVSLGQALRPMLDELQERTGLESVYLTRIDWEGAEQEILIAANRGDLIIPEGLVIAWSGTLCRRSLEAQFSRACPQPQGGGPGGDGPVRRAGERGWGGCRCVPMAASSWGWVSPMRRAPWSEVSTRR